MECAAIVDALLVLESIDEKEHLVAVDLLTEVVKMLSKLCL